jgi:hypothetical protein
MRLNRNNERRGIILMVVLALLTLFAIVGVAFVLYAQAQATAARVARESETEQRADMSPDACLALFLGQFLYDVHDTTGYGSGLRGHSLARTMYGYNSASLNINVTPFNGIERLHTNGNAAGGWPYMNPYNVDDHLLVNYTWFSADGFARDPEWYGTMQTSPTAAKGKGTFYVGANAPYTYPDLNNFYLAAVRSDGVVLTPSFHRPWLFQLNPATGQPYINPATGQPYAFNDPRNPNWSTPQGKYLTLRPRPADHAGFPYPDDATGDVKNLIWAPGGNDSIWIDIGAPVMTAPDGTKYKMMVAPLIMDLDNRINLAAAGNLSGLANTPATPSRSNQGWFPTEMNLSYILASTTVPTEWQQLFIGNSSYYGKYGPNKVPSGILFPKGSAAHWYAPADLDGRNETTGGYTAAIQLPGTAATAPANSCFPYFPTGYGSGSAKERLNHPAKYAAYKSSFYNSTNDDIVFRPSDMERLLRPSGMGQHPVDTGSASLISALQHLCPQNLELSTSAYQRRNWVTTVSNDLAKPGLSPWILNPATSPYAINAAKPSLPPLGAASAFPFFTQRAQPLLPGTDFTANWRAAAAVLGRIDLNQPLPPFPHMSSGSTPALVAPNQRFDTNPAALAASTTAMTARQNFANSIYRALLILTGADAPIINKANPLAGGAQDVLNLAARRWLAQLAANIVDYIDPDEISTPFNFYNTATDGCANIYQLVPTTTTFPAYPAGNPDVPAYWVYGTELPRVVINEVLGEYTLPTNNGAPPTATAGPFGVKVWVELFNPMPAATNATATANNTATFQPIDALPVPLFHASTGANAAYNPYELIIANNNLAANSHGLWYNTAALNSNVLGTPQHERYVNPAAKTPVPAGCYFNTGAGFAWTIAAPPPTQPKPTVPITQPGGLSSQQYMIVGPPGNDVHNDILAANITASGGNPANILYLPSPNMQYGITNYHPKLEQWHINTVPCADNMNGISVLLRRLANPHLPPNPYLPTGALQNAALPPNPFITVDYLHGVQLNGYGLSAGNAVPINQINNPVGATVNPGKPAPPSNSPVVTLGHPASYGKLQPYAANFTQLATELTTMPPGNPPPKGTPLPRTRQSLGLQNSPIASPFTWLVHLDRKLISPMELLHVSGFPNHDLTQRFLLVPNASNPVIPQPYNYTAPSILPANPIGYVAPTCFQHYVPWFDQRRRLYRLFELLEAHDGASGISAVNGRVPGKININTMWDPPSTYPQMYLAITDPSATPDNPNFTAANVKTMFQSLLTYRTPGLATPTLSGTDRPFVGMGAGVLPASDPQYPYTTGMGINHTLLTTGLATRLPITAGAQGQGPRLQLPNTTAVNPQTAHPYLQNELLTKVYNNFTTRSNVFAVFLTVGFFQVTNANTSPPTLGPEIGRSEGRQVRHRMFAIVDRTNMSTFTTTSSTTVAVAPSPSSPQPATITLNGPTSGTNLNTGSAWTIAPGMLLVVEPGTNNEETVIVTSVNAAKQQVTANFLLAHPNPAITGNPSSTYAISQRGNPGPWIRYDPRQDPGVVLYYNIID